MVLESCRALSFCSEKGETKSVNIEAVKKQHNGLCQTGNTSIQTDLIAFERKISPIAIGTISYGRY